MPKGKKKKGKGKGKGGKSASGSKLPLLTPENQQKINTIHQTTKNNSQNRVNWTRRKAEKDTAYKVDDLLYISESK